LSPSLALFRLTRPQEQHSQPIFTEEWGADEELLLVSGLIINGLGNWAEVAQHVGTRTKEDCEKHYYQVYLRAEVADKERLIIDAQMGVGVGESGVVTRKREFMPVRYDIAGLRCIVDVRRSWIETS
jgi:transcriptional adapter 2-alpha